MKTIYFMRHAQSVANKAEVLASWKDFELTDKGLKDAKTIASEFKQITNLDRIFSSPLMRAKQTAEPISNAFGLDLEIEERIVEQNLGVFAGRSHNDLDECEDYMQDRSKRWDWIPEGGESYAMLANRLEPFFQGILQLEGESILYVTHAVTMRLIKATLEQTLPQYPLESARNGEIWKVAFKGLGVAHKIESIFLGGSNQACSRA